MDVNGPGSCYHCGRIYGIPNIDNLVDRFLRWRLPADFSPDAGIEFKKPSELFPEMENADEVHWPIGTNLLDATEAKAMLEYVFSKDVEEVNLNG